MDIFNDVTAVHAIRTPMLTSVSGSILLQTYNTTGFNTLQFGGTSNSFVALKSESTTLAVRLADDSGYANLQVGNLTITGSTTGLTGLPSQTGNNGLFLTTNGTTASWSAVSGGSSQWTTEGSAIYYNNGENGLVGIGTNSPSAMLDIVSASSMANALNIRAGSGEGAYPLYIGNSGDGLISSIDSSGNFYTTGNIGTGGSSYIYLSDQYHSMSLGNNGLLLSGWEGVQFVETSVTATVGQIDQTGLHIFGFYNDPSDYAGIKIDAGQTAEDTITFSIENQGSFNDTFTNYQLLDGNFTVVGNSLIIDGGAGERCFFSQKNNGEFVWGLNVNALNGDSIDDSGNSAMKFGMMTSINEGYNGLHYQTASPSDEGWGASQTVWSVDINGNMNATSLYLPIQNEAGNAGQPYISSDNAGDPYFTGVALWCAANYELLWKNGVLFNLGPNGETRFGADTRLWRTDCSTLTFDNADGGNGYFVVTGGLGVESTTGPASADIYNIYTDNTDYSKLTIDAGNINADTITFAIVEDGSGVGQLTGGFNFDDQAIGGVSAINFTNGDSITLGEGPLIITASELMVSQNIVSTASSYSVFGYNQNTGNGVYGGYDGSSIYGAYFQSFGTTNGGGSPGPGGAEIIIDSSAGSCNFNVGFYDGIGFNVLTTVSSNNGFGINEQSPQAALHVQTVNLEQTGIIIRGSADQDNDMMDFQDENGDFLAGVDGSGGFHIPSLNVNGALCYLGSDGSAQFANGDMVVDTGGNLSIQSINIGGGTSTIDASGDAVFNSSLNVNSGTFQVNSNGSIIGAESFYADSSPLFCIAANARFGFTPDDNNPNAQPDTTLMRSDAGVMALGAGDASGTLQLSNIALQAIDQPSSPVRGQIYFDVNALHFYGYNGSAWVQLDN